MTQVLCLFPCQAIEEARIDYEAVKPRRPASAQPLRPAFQHRVSGGGGGGGGGGRDSDGGEHVAPGDVAAALAASYLQQQVAPGAGGGSGLDKWRDVPMVRVTVSGQPRNTTVHFGARIPLSSCGLRAERSASYHLRNEFRWS